MGKTNKEAAKEIFNRIGRQALDYAILIIGASVLIFGLIVASLWDWTYWAEHTIRNGVIYEVKIDRARIIQQFIIVVLGVPALGFAIWRSITAHRQATAALLQADTAARSQVLDRYTNASSLIDSEHTSVRKAGVLALADLAKDNPQQYYRACITLMSECARESSQRGLKDEPTALEFHFILQQMSSLRIGIPNSRALEETRIDLSRVRLLNEQIFSLNLRRAVIHNADFKGAQIMRCDLADTLFFRSKIENTRFNSCNLQGASFSSVTMADARFGNSNISGANFSECNGLTTINIKTAWAWLDMPPRLPSGVTFDNFFDPGADGEIRKEYLQGRVTSFEPPTHPS